MQPIQFRIFIKYSKMTFNCSQNFLKFVKNKNLT